MATRMIFCPTCGGDGDLYNLQGDLVVVCETCNGTGLASAEWQYCARCSVPTDLPPRGDAQPGETLCAGCRQVESDR